MNGKEKTLRKERPVRPKPRDFDRSTLAGKGAYDAAIDRYNRELAEYFGAKSLSEILDVDGRLPNDPKYKGPFNP